MPTDSAEPRWPDAELPSVARGRSLVGPPSPLRLPAAAAAKQTPPSAFCFSPVFCKSENPLWKIGTDAVPIGIGRSETT